MNLQEYLKALNNILKVDIENISVDEKTKLLTRHIELYKSNKDVLGYNLKIVPFIPGRRSFDEAFYPGLGSSEEIGLNTHNSKDELNFLYRIFNRDNSVSSLPKDLSIFVTVLHINKSTLESTVLPEWRYKKITPTHRGVEAHSGKIKDRFENKNQLSKAWTLSLPVNKIFEDTKALEGHSDDFSFGSMFFENYKLQLDLEFEGVQVSSDYHYFEIYDITQFGSFYDRILDQLITWDTENQVQESKIKRKIGVEYHPWYPVLCIGMEKANLYMKAIVGDVIEEKRMLTDPGWLLKVGLYLELLTCIGIIEVAKGIGKDLLSEDEREIFEKSPYFDKLRNNVDVDAWKKVWKARKISISGIRPDADMPVSFTNLLRKKSATLLFLHAHHEDLKNAIEMAGLNIHNSQETWHRVFRDAERAVLKMDEKAFKELGYLSKELKEFVLWHQQGNYFGLKLIPTKFSGAFGDQDGLYLSACRDYRNSMNYIAEWAREKGLMEFTGSECIPQSASILENHLEENYGRLKQLQNQDGYDGGIVIKEKQELENERFPAEKIFSTLSDVSIFKSLKKDELMELSRRSRPIMLGHLERIIVQGREGSSLFVIHEGTLEVIARIGKINQVLAVLQKGAVIGEYSFLTGEKRTAAVRAVDYALVIEVSADNLRPIIEKRPDLINELAKIMEERKTENSGKANRDSLISKIASTIFGKTKVNI